MYLSQKLTDQFLQANFARKLKLLVVVRTFISSQYDAKELRRLSRFPEYVAV
jgi:hypothetical protein